MRRGLAGIDPWLEPFLARPGRLSASPEFVAARRAATLSRAAAGRRAWNDWAIALREQAEDVQDDVRLSGQYGEAAVADFSGVELAGNLDLAGCSFPGPITLRGTTIGGELWLAGCTFDGAVDMAAATLGRRGAWLESSVFRAGLAAAGARFPATAELRGIRVDGALQLADAIFEADLWAVGGYFHAAASLRGAVFKGEAGFARAVFKAEADFAGARFLGNAGFEGASFQGDACFEDAVFEQSLWLRSAAFEAGARFERARFIDMRRIDLSGCRMAEPPAGPDFAAVEAAVRKRLGQ